MDRLTVVIDRNLEWMDYRVSSELLASIPHPNLLWPCSCFSAEGGQSPGNGPCAIHSHPKGNTISALFGRDTLVSFAGTTVLWKGHCCWPPSIDSLLLASRVSREWPGRKSSSLIDCGAGTGFLGIHIAKTYSFIDHLILIDSNAHSTELSRFNVLQNKLNCRWHVVPSTLADLPECYFNSSTTIVSNPPYIPQPPGQDFSSVLTNPIHGTSVIEQLVSLVAKFKLQLIIGYSSITEIDLKASLKKHNGLFCKVLCAKEVPFRISLDPSHIDWLLESRNLIKKGSDVFKYHHIINIAFISST